MDLDGFSFFDGMYEDLSIFLSISVSISVYYMQYIYIYTYHIYIYIYICILERLKVHPFPASLYWLIGFSYGL